MKKCRAGKLKTNGVALKRHEIKTIEVFLTLGSDVELIVPSNKRNTKTADFIMSGLKWEMKGPRGKGKYVLRDTLVRADKQSKNIVIDLRRIGLNDTKSMREIQKYSMTASNIKRVKVITKHGQVIDAKYPS